MGSKHFFNQRGAKVTAIDFHKKTGILVVGFSNGIFDLFEVRPLHCPSQIMHQTEQKHLTRYSDFDLLKHTTTSECTVTENICCAVSSPPLFTS